MRCDVCPSYFTAEQCTEFQCIHGCHACDRRNCWRDNPLCLFGGMSRSTDPVAGAWGEQGCGAGFGLTDKHRNESWQNVRIEGCQGGQPGHFKVVFADSHRELYATEDARVRADER